jgi:hypothetical protein
VGPDGEPLIGEIAPGAVQLGVPVVQVADVGGLEGDAFHPEGQHARARVERDDVAVSWRA